MPMKTTPWWYVRSQLAASCLIDRWSALGMMECAGVFIGACVLQCRACMLLSSRRSSVARPRCSGPAETRPKLTLSSRAEQHRPSVEVDLTVDLRVWHRLTVCHPFNLAAAAVTLCCGSLAISNSNAAAYILLDCLIVLRTPKHARQI